MNELTHTKFILLKKLRAKIKLNLRTNANIHTELEICVVRNRLNVLLVSLYFLLSVLLIRHH